MIGSQCDLGVCGWDTYISCQRNILLHSAVTQNAFGLETVVKNPSLLLSVRIGLTLDLESKRPMDEKLEEESTLPNYRRQTSDASRIALTSLPPNIISSLDSPVSTEPHSVLRTVEEGQCMRLKRRQLRRMIYTGFSTTLCAGRI